MYEGRSLFNRIALRVLNIKKLDINYNNEEFRGLENFALETVVHDFEDNQLLLYEEAVFLEKVTVERIAEIGRETIPCLYSGFSRKTAAALFVLAYNLRCGKNNEFADAITDPSPNIVSDLAFDFLSDKNFPGNVGDRDIIPTKNVEAEAAFYTYIAASTLSMFKQPTENYERAWSHILTMFTRFYCIDPPVSLQAPRNRSLELLVDAWTSDPIFKPTLYKFLYCASTGTSVSAGVRRFLYENRLANTGLHVIVSITVNLIQKLNCSAATLLPILYCQRFSRQYEALTRMLIMVSSTEAKHERQMWRYGRVFNENFMTSLLTKKCPFFVGVLAWALITLSPKEFEGLLKIKQLAELEEENMNKCMLCGLNLIREVTKRVNM